MSNHLSGSTSPYLLQHAQNPVDWYPWGAPALEKARREEKPIFLSIGYAACHWCHVMAHESFEDPACAAILNRHFVAIKVDREERPDLDSIYMDAVVRISGQGGWPMSVFLTPDLQPFYAGTYFPPLARHGLPAFSDLLLSVAEAWQERRAEVLRAGAQMAELISARAAPQPGADDLDPALLANAGARLLTTYDRVYGGWGAAPKFPQPMLIEFLFRRHLSGDERALPAALHTLRAMAQGAMHDLIGGGFARYAVDAEWRVPHFEKMLYDNALLAPVYLHAYQLSGDLFFRRICLDTLAFMARELRSPAGGFYSSLDADSEGEEGRFYAWTHAELRQALGEDDDLFSAAHELPAGGNWEGKNLLRRSTDDRTLAARFALPQGEVEARLRAAYARLFAVRSSRPRPATDDKVLAAWNGLALAAFAEAGRVLEDSALLEIARTNAAFLLEALAPGGHLRRAWRQGVASEEVFLDDHAALILGLLELYQADFDPRWYAAADQLARTMIARFTDGEGGFFDTPADAPALLTRPQDVQDNAVPSGGALAAEALLRLYAYGGESVREAAALAAIARVAPQAERYPAAFGRWLCAADFYLHPGPQVALVGDPNDGRMRAFRDALRAYDPRRVIAASAFPAPAGGPALLDDKPLLGGAPTAYVCRGFVCLRPVTDAPGLKAALSAEVV